MSNGPAATATAQTAAEIGRDIKLGGKARRLLDDRTRPGPYLGLLVEKHLYPDAVRFMARALPGREAIWWACLCARHVGGDDLAAAARAALGAAVRWVLDPIDANRQAALGASLVAGGRTPAGCAARAAYFAVGAPQPQGVTAAPAVPVLAAKLVAGSIFLAASRGGPAELSLNYRQFLAWGLDVAYGTNRWE